MSTKIPCMNPREHGVKNHIAGTDAARECQAGRSKKSDVSAGFPAPVGAATTPAPFFPSHLSPIMNIVNQSDEIGWDNGEVFYALTMSGSSFGEGEYIVFRDLSGSEGNGLVVGRYDGSEAPEGWDENKRWEDTTEVLFAASDTSGEYERGDWDYYEGQSAARTAESISGVNARALDEGLLVSRGSASPEDFSAAISKVLSNHGTGLIGLEDPSKPSKRGKPKG